MIVVDLTAALVASVVTIVAALILRPPSRKILPGDVSPCVIRSLGSKIPIIGDVLDAVKHSDVRHDWLFAHSARFNFEPWFISIPGTAGMVVVTDPKTAEVVTTAQFDNFIKCPAHIDNLHDLFGGGLVSTDGEQWYHQRKTVAKFFSAKTLRLMMMYTMRKNMQQVYEVLDRHESTQVNLTLLFHQFTLQTFLEVGVGIPFPLIGRTEPHAFELAVDETTPLISRRGVLPPFVWKLERWLGLGPEKQLKNAMLVIHTHIKQMIDESLTGNNKPESEATHTAEKIRSAVDLFAAHSNEEKAGLRAEDLVDFVLNFVVAARDTSSVTIQWFFYALSKHPHVEKKIRQELADKLQAFGIDRDGYITADHVKQLVYLDATIMETLRLYPAGPFIMRHAVEDTIVDGNLFIAKTKKSPCRSTLWRATHTCGGRMRPCSSPTDGLTNPPA